MTEKKSKPHLEIVKNYLERFEWAPESISEEDGQYFIVLKATIDIKEITIQIRFSEDSHWIYFSTLFFSSIEKNHEKVYEKLLSLNYITTLTKFGIDISKNGSIYAMIELPLKELDFLEFETALKRLVNDVNKYLPIIAQIIRSDEP